MSIIDPFSTPPKSFNVFKGGRLFLWASLMLCLLISLLNPTHLVATFPHITMQLIAMHLFIAGLLSPVMLSLYAYLFVMIIIDFIYGFSAFHVPLILVLYLAIIYIRSKAFSWSFMTSYCAWANIIFCFEVARAGLMYLTKGISLNITEMSLVISLQILIYPVLYILLNLRFNALKRHQ